MQNRARYVINIKNRWNLYHIPILRNAHNVAVSFWLFHGGKARYDKNGFYFLIENSTSEILQGKKSIGTRRLQQIFI